MVYAMSAPKANAGGVRHAVFTGGLRPKAGLSYRAPCGAVVRGKIYQWDPNNPRARTTCRTACQLLMKLEAAVSSGRDSAAREEPAVSLRAGRASSACRVSEGDAGG